MADDPRELIPYIRDSAIKHGVDPDIAVRVARSEGLNSFLGDQGKSGGAFQLYTGGGLGNTFQKQTGLNPLDPNNEKATIDFALQQAAQGGWGPWNGAKKSGILGMQGINGQVTNNMASDTTPPSTGGDTPPSPSARPASIPAAQPTNTLSMNSPLAGMTAPNAGAANPLHSNEAINSALMNAFRPIIPDQVNSLLGPAIGQIQGRANPIAFYQPRPAAQIITGRSS